MNVIIGDLVGVFVKTSAQKRGKWLIARSILGIDRTMRAVNVPRLQRKVISIALEDVRPSPDPDSFVATVQKVNDMLDDTIADALDDLDRVTATKDTHPDAQGPCNSDLTNSVVVCWEKAFFLRKFSDAIDLRVEVQYDDGDNENLDLQHETWRFASWPAASIFTADPPVLASTAQEDLGIYLDTFGNKPFMRDQAEGLPLHGLHTSYCAEEESFTRNVSAVARADLPADDNLIRSYVIYKVEVGDYGLLKLKAQIALHGNEYSLKNYLRTDSASCVPNGARLLILVCVIP